MEHLNPSIVNGTEKYVWIFTPASSEDVLNNLALLVGDVFESRPDAFYCGLVLMGL